MDKDQLDCETMLLVPRSMVRFSIGKVEMPWSELRFEAIKHFIHSLAIIMGKEVILKWLDNADVNNPFY